MALAVCFGYAAWLSPAALKLLHEVIVGGLSLQSWQLTVPLQCGWGVSYVGDGS